MNLSNFDELEAIIDREEAIRRVGEANQPFVRAMVERIEAVAKSHDTFTAAECWKEYDGPEPTDGRAMGSAIRLAVDEGMIISTGTKVPSGRRSDHNDPITLWKSLIYNRGNHARIH